MGYQSACGGKEVAVARQKSVASAVFAGHLQTLFGCLAAISSRLSLPQAKLPSTLELPPVGGTAKGQKVTSCLGGTSCTPVVFSRSELLLQLDACPVVAVASAPRKYLPDRIVDLD